MAVGIKTGRGQAKMLSPSACGSVKLPFLKYERVCVLLASYLECLVSNGTVFKCKGNNLSLYIYTWGLIKHILFTYHT